MREADCADRVRDIFARDGTAWWCPRIHREWSTRRVLTMELVDGIKITEKRRDRGGGPRPEPTSCRS